MKQIGIPFYRPVNGVTRLFNIGERYETVGSTYKVGELCGPCGGKTMKYYDHILLLVDGDRVPVKTEWLVEPSPQSEAPAPAMETVAANYGTKPTFSSPDFPDIRRDQENKEAFNDMATFDLRDHNSIQRPYAHDKQEG